MSLVVVESSGGVCTITLSDIERRNALSAALLSQLWDALDAAEADPAVRVIVLTNAGGTFCAGADLAQRTGRTGDDAGTRVIGMTDLFDRITSSPKPYVGRIAGHCVAGGVGLAASLDISIAVDDVKFGFTEVRIGVAPAMISVVCLPKMRATDARAAMLRGNRFPAAEAARIGLITDAVPADRLDGAVAEVVADLLAGGPLALAATKQLFARVPQLDTADAFAWTAELSASLFASEEGQAGMAAFLDKRPAPWIPGGNP